MMNSGKPDCPESLRIVSHLNKNRQINISIISIF